MAMHGAGSARSRYWLELAATLILSLATVGSAYSAWRSSWWGSVQAAETAEAAYLQTESVRAANRHNTQVHVDAASWLAWIEAMSVGDTALAQFLASHFRPEFRASFDVWLAGAPAGGEGSRTNVPPGSPFTPELYRSVARDESRALQGRSYAASERARLASGISTRFVLTVVIYASVLFMAGLSLKVQTLHATLGLLGVATCLLIAAMIVTALAPADYRGGERDDAARNPTRHSGVD